MFLLLVVMLDRPNSDVGCKTTGYPLHSPLSPSLPLPCITVCHQIPNELYEIQQGHCFMLPLLTLLAEATITSTLVTPLLNAAFRQSVPSQLLFSTTPGFVASHYNFNCLGSIKKYADSETPTNIGSFRTLLLARI